MSKISRRVLCLVGVASCLVAQRPQIIADQDGVKVDQPAGQGEEKSGRTDMPDSRAAGDMLGRDFPLDQLSWVRKPLEELAGRVTLVRWWTDTCPYCERSLPAMTRLREKFSDRGFETIAVYHPKPPREVRAQAVKRFAVERDYEGPLAADLDWSLLKKFYLARHPHQPTSVSFVLDREGLVRFVHPGPVFFKSDDPESSDANRDYEEVSSTIEFLLKGKE